METEIVIPAELPLMTLPRIAFLPHATIPLHIFEPRYREMLRDVLATNRLFAVAGRDYRQPDAFEPAHRMATVGMIRACQESKDGTSNLLLQGLSRVEIQAVIQEEPYRIVRVQTMESFAGADAEQNVKLRTQLTRLLVMRQRLSGEPMNPLTRLFEAVEDPSIFADLAAYNFCENVRLKQKLLETLNVNERLELLRAAIRADIDSIKLQNKLQGGLSDEGILNN
jgi:ATP-dependent Lon protease